MFQGPLKQTDGALDLAVSGLGFLTLIVQIMLKIDFIPEMEA